MISRRSAANLLTALRALLLPVPIWMLYQGTPAWEAGALGAYLALGLTDVIDGRVARRWGSTPLGRVLDGLVDRLFIVAVYIPFCDRQFVPTVAVAVLLSRELAMRWLRGVLSAQGVVENASFLGKLKTTVEFAGAGFILLIRVLGDSPATGWLLAAPPLAALAFGLVAKLEGRRPGPWVEWGPPFLAFVWAARLFGGPEQAAAWIMTLVVLVALLAAAEAVWNLKRSGVQLEVSRGAAARLVAGAFVVPALFFPLVGGGGWPALVAGAVLAAELSIGGIENALPVGARMAEREHGLRLALLSAAGGFLLFSRTMEWISPTAILAGLVIAVEIVVTALRFRKLASVCSTSPPHLYRSEEEKESA